jgi:DNA repair exonuclease SbcCD ATPase subunit
LGFPDCGNLRSTKRKDVKMRVRVLQALVKQRKKDLEFRNSFQDKFSKQDVDFDALKDKVRGLESKIHLAEKEKQNLKNILKDKDDEIR